MGSDSDHLELIVNVHSGHSALKFNCFEIVLFNKMMSRICTWSFIIVFMIYVLSFVFCSKNVRNNNNNKNNKM